MFNRYIWQLYLKAGGKQVVKKFEDNLSQNFSADYITFIKELHQEYQLSESILSDESKQLHDLLVFFQEGNRFCDKNELSSEEAIGILYLILSENETVDFKETFSRFTYSLAYYSTMLAVSLPDLFIPYYFKWNYNVLQIIADTFGIELPEIPNKSDYEGRICFYEDVCASLQEFRKGNYLTPYELCAFLYDFAPKYIGGLSSYLIQELPEPHSAFLLEDQRMTCFCRIVWIL